MPTQNILRQAGTAGLQNYPNAAGILHNSTDGFVYYDNAGTPKTVVNEEDAQTISGNKTFSGTTTLSGPVTIAGLGLVQVVVVALTNAQVLALRATPITIIPAPGAGFFVEFLGGHINFDYTAAYTETDDDLVLRYTGTTGAIVTETVPGELLEATADAGQTLVPITALVVANGLVCLHNTGGEEFGGGNAANVVTVTARYRINAIP